MYLLPIGCLVIVDDQADPCCVISKLNDGFGVVLSFEGTLVLNDEL
jgi:hypothetical protein